MDPVEDQRSYITGKKDCKAILNLYLFGLKCVTLYGSNNYGISKTVLSSVSLPFSSGCYLVYYVDRYHQYVYVHFVWKCLKIATYR